MTFPILATLPVHRTIGKMMWLIAAFAVICSAPQYCDAGSLGQIFAKASVRRIAQTSPVSGGARAAAAKNGYGIRAKGASSEKPADVVISRRRYPETAAHIEEAQRLSQPSVLTIDRIGAAQRRHESLVHVKRRGGRQIIGRDRDEYPPAMTREGGFNSDVRYVGAADNRGAGKNFANQVRNLPEGARIRVLVAE